MMNFDDSEPRNVIKKEEIFRGKYFYTVLYYLKNGNKTKRTFPTWRQTDFGNEIKETQEEKLEKQAYKMRHRKKA